MDGFRHAILTVALLLFAALAGVFPTTAVAEQVKDLPQPTDYVSDYAGVLSQQTIAQLDSICAQLDHSKTNAQIAIVTVHNVNGDDPADFANALEDHWKMGNKGLNRYALVLLAVDDHKYRIEVGYGLEGILPDGKVGDIGREMVPYLRSKDYDSAVNMAVGQVAQVIAADSGVSLSDQPAPPPAPSQPRGGFPIPIIIFLAFFLTSIVVRILHAIGAALGLWNPWPRYMGPGGGGFMIGGGGGGGGGDGGGGGGFGGFGGGGGGFGGGGAGGSW